jgi:hypothetical protein
MLGAFNGHDITYILYHTYHGLVSVRIGAYVTTLVIREIVARVAEMYVFLKVCERIGESFYTLFIPFDQFKDKSKGGLSSYAAQGCHLVHCGLYEFGGMLHVAKDIMNEHCSAPSCKRFCFLCAYGMGRKYQEDENILG